MAKKPDKKTREQYKRAINFGCVVCKKMGIWSEPQIHHQGEQGIHYLGNKTWEKNYGLQEELYKWYIENDRD